MLIFLPTLPHSSIRSSFFSGHISRTEYFSLAMNYPSLNFLQNRNSHISFCQLLAGHFWIETLTSTQSSKKYIKTLVDVDSSTDKLKMNLSCHSLEYSLSPLLFYRSGREERIGKNSSFVIIPFSCRINSEKGYDMQNWNKARVEK